MKTIFGTLSQRASLGSGSGEWNENWHDHFREHTESNRELEFKRVYVRRI
jgi:hypothetical protein